MTIRIAVPVVAAAFVIGAFSAPAFARNTIMKDCGVEYEAAKNR